MTTDTKSEKSTEKHSVGGKSGKTVKRKSRSLILYYLNMFTAFIYSLFRRGRIGRFISGNDDFFEESTWDGCSKEENRTRTVKDRSRQFLKTASRLKESRKPDIRCLLCPAMYTDFSFSYTGRQPLFYITRCFL